jgi:2-polyprenyl-3-methyl-5-hydroxy-6-metoxy-1,4-benzoquinol methylase
MAKAINPSIRYICGNIVNDQLLKDKYDIITLIEVLEHISPNEIDNFIKSLSYYLNKNGYLIITVPSKKIRVSRKHYQHFNLESLISILKPYFKIIEYNYINKRSKWVKLIKILLTNRFFLLNEKHILNIIYKNYEKYLFLTNKNNAKRIFGIFIKE